MVQSSAMTVVNFRVGNGPDSWVTWPKSRCVHSKKKKKEEKKKKNDLQCYSVLACFWFASNWFLTVVYALVIMEYCMQLNLLGRFNIFFNAVIDFCKAIILTRYQIACTFSQSSLRFLLQYNYKMLSQYWPLL